MWLPLAEYSLKHKVSISTLRRKIKAADIEYRLEDGKYFILDSAEDHRPSLNRDTASAEVSPKIETQNYQRNVIMSQNSPQNISQNSILSQMQTPQNFQQTMTTHTGPQAASVAGSPLASNGGGESVITAANRLLADLKKAYTQVLQDKELQIQSLREEISDLKTLIKVLESENDRLRDQA